MTFGLSDKEYALFNQVLLEPMKNKGVKVWIFGSRARGDQKKFSDIDILFDAGNSSISKSEIHKIKDNLEESRFPYKVDLVAIENLAESYRDNVMAERLELC